MRYAFVAGLVLACSSPNKPPSTTPAPAPTPPAPDATSDGLVPPQPTLRLPQNFLPTAYDLKLEIDPAKTKFQGVAAIAG